VRSALAPRALPGRYTSEAPGAGEGEAERRRLLLAACLLLLLLRESDVERVAEVCCWSETGWWCLSAVGAVLATLDCGERPRSTDGLRSTAAAAGLCARLSLGSSPGLQVSEGGAARCKGAIRTDSSHCSWKKLGVAYSTREPRCGASETRRINTHRGAKENSRVNAEWEMEAWPTVRSISRSLKRSPPSTMAPVWRETAGAKSAG
jgi:hypothetical protein